MTPERQVDLHCHTEFSVDGYGTPEALIARARQLGLGAVSVTEHNSLASTPRAVRAARQAGVAYLPGVELDLHWDAGKRRSHFLCYWFDTQNERFAQFVAQSNKVYDLQINWIFEELEALGRPIERDAFQEWLDDNFPTNPQGSLWRLALFLVIAGAIPREKPVDFLLALAATPAPWPFPSLEQALPVIRQAHGLLLLAHPCRQADAQTGLELTRMALESDLVDGFEMYHKSSPEELAPFVALHRHYDAAVSGGSDCHSLQLPNAPFGLAPAVPEAVLQTLERAYRRRYRHDPPPLS